MATAYAQLERWDDRPTIVDEQADILRNALRMRGSARAQLDDVVWLEGWEATFLIEAAREAEVGPEALALLEARAAEWASRKALRADDDLAPYAALVDGVLDTLGAVREGFAQGQLDAVAEIVGRLAALRRELEVPPAELATVVAWPADEPVAVDVDEAPEPIPDLDLEDLPAEGMPAVDPLDDDIDLALIERIDDRSEVEPSLDISSDDLPTVELLPPPQPPVATPAASLPTPEVATRPARPAPAATRRAWTVVVPILVAAIAAAVGAVVLLG